MLTLPLRKGARHVLIHGGNDDGYWILTGGRAVETARLADVDVPLEGVLG